MQKSETRLPFQDQLCQIVIVDTLSTSPYVVQTFTKSLLSSVTLAASVRGAARVPALGLLALGRQLVVNCPLLEPRGRLEQLRAAAVQLVDQARVELGSFGPEDGGDRVDAALDMVSGQMADFCSRQGTADLQLQLTVLTAEPELAVRLRPWCRATADTARLQRVQVFQVLNFGGPEDLDADVSCDVGGDVGGDGDVAQVPLDVTRTYGEAETFQEYFQSWLQDQSTSSAHVRLLLPPLEAPLSLRGDLQAALVSPLSLPFAHRLLLMPEKTGWHAGGRGEVAVHQLEVTGRLPRAGVCQSVIHGEPLLLRPTACWRLTWHELVTNRQRLAWLCGELRAAGDCLLARLAAGSSRPDVAGRFLLLPAAAADGAALLVCALAPAELVLPPGGGAPQQPDEAPPPEVRQEIHDRLTELPRLEDYNPLEHSCGLSEALAALSQKPTGYRPPHTQNASGQSAAERDAAGGPRGAPSSRGGAAGRRGSARGARSRGRPLFWKDDWSELEP